MSCQGHYFKSSPVDSILDAVLTVSPNKQYLGILRPTTPEQTGPLKNKKILSICIKHVSCTPHGFTNTQFRIFIEINLGLGIRETIRRAA